MAFEELSFSSANNRHRICAWIYTPISEPRGIVQIMHGMGEHSRRYLHMIDAFLEAGYAVCADDHLAHGKTGLVNDGLGNPGTRGADGYLAYLADERTLHDEAARRFGELPHFVFGHSWGSMLARGYASQHGADLAGVMLCGVVSQFAGFERLAARIDEIAAVAEAEPDRSGASLLAEGFAGMTDRFGPDAAPNAWIALDPRIVADHARDPFNSFDMSVQFIYDVVRLYGVISDETWARGVAAHIAFHLIAGDQDPTTNFAEGLYHTANALAESGHAVSARVHAGYRHEIHNERAIRDEVERDLIGFMDRVLECG